MEIDPVKTRIFEPRPKLKVSMLEEGKFYLQASGHFVRKIDSIIGKKVSWHDKVGSGQCTKETFIKNCIHEATSHEVAEHVLKSTLRNRSDTDAAPCETPSFLPKP